MNFSYNMPTQIFFGKDILKSNDNIFDHVGKKAFIITGKNSSKKNGSLKDIEDILKNRSIEYVIFDSIEENPSVETVSKAVDIGKANKVDFIIGIGGGSPIDAAKAISVLIKNPSVDAYDIFTTPNLKAFPVIAIPTTAGTGTEVTQYAILTNNIYQTKMNFNQSVFPTYAFLDPSYMLNTPHSITVNTAIDALSHLIEGYLSVDSNVVSNMFAKEGLRIFSNCLDNIKNSCYKYETRENLALASLFAGIVIAQSGTSLPHGMGYALTYNFDFPHGKANGVLLSGYLELCNKTPELKVKVNEILSILGFASLTDFDIFINDVLGHSKLISKDLLSQYAMNMVSNEGKLKKHLGKVNYDDIYNIYVKALHTS